MTIHKIDREKLAEAVRITKLPHSEHKSFEILDYSAKHGEQFFRIVEKAAENWLAITDPGFEVPEEMWDGLARKIMLGRDMGWNRGHEMRKHLELSGYEIPGWLREETPFDKHLAKGDICVMVYKAMIATMIKGE